MGDDSVRSLRRARMITLATLLLLPAIAYAQSPWERAANNLALTFTGPLARALALAARATSRNFFSDSRLRRQGVRRLANGSRGVQMEYIRKLV